MHDDTLAIQHFFLDVPINKGLASLYLTLGLTIAIITLILNK